MFVGSALELFGIVGWHMSDVKMPPFFWFLIVGLNIRDICQMVEIRRSR